MKNIHFRWFLVSPLKKLTSFSILTTVFVFSDHYYKFQTLRVPFTTRFWADSSQNNHIFSFKCDKSHDKRLLVELIRFWTFNNGRKIRKMFLKLKMKWTFSMEGREVFENECFWKMLQKKSRCWSRSLKRIQNVGLCSY